MKSHLKWFLNEPCNDREALIELLSTKDPEVREALFEKAAEVRQKHKGEANIIRGLIEYSNMCTRNCHYCGIKGLNRQVFRYAMKEQEVLDAVTLAWDNGLRSVVIQSGERSDRAFIQKIGVILEQIRLLSAGEISVTLSCGEQKEDTYSYWKECGAERYLLRIETSNQELYSKLHPNDSVHRFKNRLLALEAIKNSGYQTGSGVMIGLPGQSHEMLAQDLIFLRNFEVDMVGMGPYIEHVQAPLPYSSDITYQPAERLELSFRMIALLRLLMPHINIAASTALQVLAENGRLQALKCGANVAMPNITPLQYREDYMLYNNKPGIQSDGIQNINYWKKAQDELALK